MTVLASGLGQANRDVVIHGTTLDGVPYYYQPDDPIGHAYPAATNPSYFSTVVTEEHRERLNYAQAGYNRAGYDREGYDRAGYNVEGYTRQGYDRAGYDRAGYDGWGYDRAGYDPNGQRDPQGQAASAGGGNLSLDGYGELYDDTLVSGDPINNPAIKRMFSSYCTGLTGKPREVLFREGGGAATDMEGRIYLNPYPLGKGVSLKANIAVVYEGLTHELGHELYTNLDHWRQVLAIRRDGELAASYGIEADGQQLIAHLYNIIEDGRMERQVATKAGAAEKLAIGCKLQPRWDEQVGAGVPLEHEVYGAMLYTSLPYFKVRDEIRLAMSEAGRKLFEELEPLVVQGVLGSQADALSATLEITRRLQNQAGFKQPDESLDIRPPADPHAPGDSDPATGSSSAGSSASNNSNQNGESDNTSKSQSGTGSEPPTPGSADQGQGQGNSAGESTSTGTSGGNTQSPGEPLANAAASSSSSSAASTGTSSASAAAAASENEGNSANNSATKGGSGGELDKDKKPGSSSSSSAGNNKPAASAAGSGSGAVKDAKPAPATPPSAPLSPESGATGSGSPLRDINAEFSETALREALDEIADQAASYVASDVARQAKTNGVGQRLQAPLTGNPKAADSQLYLGENGIPRSVFVEYPRLTDVPARYQTRRIEHAKQARQLGAYVKNVCDQVEASLDMQTRGKLDRGRFVGAVKGQRDVYTQAVELPQTSFATSIAVDLLPSMGELQADGSLYDATMVLTDALHQLEMPCEVRGFSSGSYQFKSFGDAKFEETRAMTLNSAGGSSTHLSETANLQATALGGRPEKNRVQICLTDGLLSDHAETVATLAKARKEGIQTFGIFLGSNPNPGKMDELYGKGGWVTISNLKDLPRTVGLRITTLMQRLRKS